MCWIVGLGQSQTKFSTVVKTFFHSFEPCVFWLQWCRLQGVLTKKASTCGGESNPTSRCSDQIRWSDGSERSTCQPEMSLSSWTKLWHFTCCVLAWCTSFCICLCSVSGLQSVLQQWLRDIDSGFKHNRTSLLTPHTSPCSYSPQHWLWSE